jgi:hypothetical protein
MAYTDLTLRELMELPLPSYTEQKRLYFRPSPRQIHHVYELINYHVFNNKLRKPRLIIAPRRQKYWGMCIGNIEMQKTGSYCDIELMDKWISVQWMVATLAHEMVHQYQWDILGPQRYDEGKPFLMSHGPSFFSFKDKLEDHFIPLKTAHSQRKWYKHQDLFKT